MSQGPFAVTRPANVDTPGRTDARRPPTNSNAGEARKARVLATNAVHARRHGRRSGVVQRCRLTERRRQSAPYVKGSRVVTPRWERPPLHTCCARHAGRGCAVGAGAGACAARAGQERPRVRRGAPQAGFARATRRTRNRSLVRGFWRVFAAAAARAGVPLGDPGGTRKGVNAPRVSPRTPHARTRCAGASAQLSDALCR